MINRILHKSGSSGSGEADDAPIYPGDIETEEETVPEDLLYNTKGKIIYANNLVFWLRWVFSQSNENLFPVAQVNDEDVCGEHSSEHVVGYKLDAKDLSSSTKTFSIKMKLKSSGTECKWNGSASCTYRIWFGARHFDAAEAAHKLEKSGMCGTAVTFKVAVDCENGTVSLS